MEMTRQDKIEFLKGLRSGERELSELDENHNKWRQFICNQDKPGLYKKIGEGVKINPEIITEEQLSEVRKQTKNVLVITIHRGRGELGEKYGSIESL